MEECRREAELARRAAEFARVDAEQTLLAGREEIRFELERLREAHELRVANAAKELEAERRRDEEATAHAVRAAELGVAAALGEASAAVEGAREETREAAAAFSITLTLRAWWMHARHKGELFRESAVEALRAPRRRESVRDALREWSRASPSPAKKLRAARWHLSRSRRRGWLGWLHAVRHAAAAAAAANRHASVRTDGRVRRYKRDALRRWMSATEYEYGVRVAFHRVTVMLCTR